MADNAGRSSFAMAWEIRLENSRLVSNLHFMDVVILGDHIGEKGVEGDLRLSRLFDETEPQRRRRTPETPAKANTGQSAGPKSDSAWFSRFPPMRRCSNTPPTRAPAVGRREFATPPADS